jgi:hypothetical protein
VVNFLVRKGIVENRDERTLLDDAEGWSKEPSLAQLARAGVSGSIPAGPELRRRSPVSLRGQPDVEVISPWFFNHSSASLCAASMGFTLHAATTVSAHDVRAREALARYYAARCVPFSRWASL